MESSAVLRSFNCSVGTLSYVRSLHEKPGMLPMFNPSLPTLNRSYNQGLTVSRKFISKPLLASCLKTPEANKTATSNDSVSQNFSEKTRQNATFPSGFEALVQEVCDETEVAELKLKVGDFEMHLKRNVGANKAPMSTISPMTPPPIPTEPMVGTAPASPPPSAPKSSIESANPFKNVPLGKSSKLAALEASGSNAHVLVPSPTVGSFRKGRTLKGKKQAPICKEGDVIKEGQVIGYVDQFGTELPVKSDVGGEVLKVLFDEGEAVGYGDPLVAVLPSFHGIN